MQHVTEHGLTLTLTAEQEHVARVTTGLHAVLCGAGTAKTTTTAARTHTLIRNGADPARILATTYGKKAAEELKARVRALPDARAVQVGTIHHFGNAIISAARNLGLSSLASPHGDNAERHLFILAKRDLSTDGALRREIGRINEEDFFTYLEIMKGNLMYADLNAADLNGAHLKHATQASARNPVYLALYQAFERIRREQNLLTFNDMISGAWELMLRHPSLLERVQARYDHVLVDEYQDVNLAMKLMIDLIAGRAVSYMAIGDDDQTIYSWRGSSPRFLRDFAALPAVQTHHLSLNFRSTGNVTALGSAVIAQNHARLPKHLTLTQGLGGATHLHVTDSQSETFLREVRAALTRHEPRDIAVIIRRYGQTASLEHVLLHAGIPYRVIGSVPFFERPEVRAVIAHLRVAAFDARRLDGHQASASELKDAAGAFISAYARPTRFLSRAQADALIQDVQRTPTLTFSRALTHLPLTGANSTLVARFADDLARIGRQFSSDIHPARQVISDLVHGNGYLDALRQDAPLEELGAEKVESITALMELAGNRPVSTFLDSLDVLTQKHVKERLSDQDNVLTFITAYRAKGLEWPCVFIPDADTDTYHARVREDASGGHKDAEEERRVFYVAITRAKQELHLMFEPRDTRNGPTQLTSFLTDAGAQDLIRDVERLKQILLTPASTWTAEQAYHAALTTHRRHFSWWVQERWTGNGAAVSAALHALRAALDAGGVTHDLTDDVLEPWTLFGDLPGETPAGLDDLLVLLRAAPVSVPLRTGAFVRHPQMGEGQVTDVVSGARGDVVTVNFSGQTKRYLAQHAGLTVVSRTLN